jgi:two-component system sensor histidine kinase HydH
MAALAAWALALTVMTARSELAAASETLVAGEAHVMLGQLREHLSPLGPPSAASLQSALDALRPVGLRYVGVIDERGQIGAGTLTLRPEPGKIAVGDGAAALLVELPGPAPPRGDGPIGAPPMGGPLGDGPRPDGARGALPRPGLRASMVIEFTPAFDARLRAGATRTTFIAGGAIVVLLLFAASFTYQSVRQARVAATEERQRRLAALGQMSSVMAHELRNPLASLKGHAQLLLESSPQGSAAERKAARVVSEAERLERLTNELLAFVGDGAIERQPVDAEPWVRGAIGDELAPRVRVRVRPDDLRLSIDGARLALAVTNLARNAVAANGEAEGGVELTLETDGDDASIVVRDHGPGLPSGQEQRLFEPFFTTKSQGTGLGLAVARRAVEQHGGTVVARNHPDGGAELRVTLPKAVLARRG